MPKPKGTLTGTQLEIMEVVWTHDGRGATVAEVWRELSAGRSVARTTVLTLVSRLEKRGWLIRDKAKGASRFRAACDREDATGGIAEKFVKEFFDGSASNLVQSLLGSNKIMPDELDRLRKLIKEAGKE